MLLALAILPSRIELMSLLETLFRIDFPQLERLASAGKCAVRLGLLSTVGRGTVSPVTSSERRSTGRSQALISFASPQLVSSELVAARSSPYVCLHMLEVFRVNEYGMQGCAGEALQRSSHPAPHSDYNTEW